MQYAQDRPVSSMPREHTVQRDSTPRGFAESPHQRCRRIGCNEGPTGALPVVALQIDTHVMNHVTAAPTATLSSGLSGGQPRCLGKHGVHVNLLRQV
jgi:hypothetical protein